MSNEEFVVMPNGDLVLIKTSISEIEGKTLIALYGDDAVDVSSREFSYDVINGRTLYVNTEKGIFEYMYIPWGEHYLLLNVEDNYVPLKVSKEVLGEWIDKG